MQAGEKEKDEKVSWKKKNPWKKENPWKKGASWILLALLLLSLVTMIVYGSRKTGYHVDEIYSYGLANSEYLPFMHFGKIEYGVRDWMKEYGAGESLGDLFRNVIKDFQILKECNFQLKESILYQDYVTAQANSSDTRTSTWVSGQDYLDYVAVSESNTFNYASVYYNQRGDVHPPLYYMILHTICSVFQGVFSKWFALSVNFGFLLLTLLVLYQMVREYLGGETVALVTVACYGLSYGFMNTAVWMRMYALLTFMVVLTCYIHLKIAGEEFRLKGKNRWCLMLVVLCGYLTHYYFILYAIGIAMVFTGWMLVKKRWREAVSYLLTLAGAAAIGLCVWPYAVRHVFSGYQGQEALGTILAGEFYFIKIKLLVNQIVQSLFGGNIWILVLCLCAVAAVMIRDICGNADRRDTSGRQLLAKGLLITVPIIFYTVIVAQIVPMLIERYVMCTFPFWILFAVESVALVLRELTAAGKFSLKWKNGILALAGLLLFAVNNGYRAEPVGLYHGEQDTVKLPENTDCVYVLPDDDWNESAIDTLILAQCRRVGVVYDSELECLAQDYEYEDGDYVLVAIQKDMDIQEVLTRVRAVLGLEELEIIEEREGATAIRMLLTR